jgi:hypothetical protein
MRQFLVAAFLLLRALAAPTGAQDVKAPDEASRFAAVDVFIDSKNRPLAAYQFVFAVERGDAKIVGVEGGAHPAFRTPPYHDPDALSKGRIVIAAFNTGKDLPTGRTRVATLHLLVRGDRDPDYVVRVQTAATPDGGIISARASTEKGD